MDAAKAKDVRILLNSVFLIAEARFKEAGLSVTVKAGSFNPSGITFKVELAEFGTGGEVMTQDAQAFKDLSTEFGVPADALFQQYKVPGRPVYQFVGLKTRASKYPFLVKGLDGKTYKIAADAATAMLKYPVREEGEGA